MIDPPGIPQHNEDLRQYGKSETIGTLNEVPEPMEHTVMEIKSLRENQSFVKVRIDENDMSQHKNFKSFLHSFHAVLEEFPHTVVGLLTLDIRPVSHIELQIHQEIVNIYENKVQLFNSKLSKKKTDQSYDPSENRIQFENSGEDS